MYSFVFIYIFTDIEFKVFDMDIGFKVSDIALVSLSETRRLLYKLLGEEYLQLQVLFYPWIWT